MAKKKEKEKERTFTVTHTFTHLEGEHGTEPFKFAYRSVEAASVGIHQHLASFGYERVDRDKAEFYELGATLQLLDMTHEWVITEVEVLEDDDVLSGDPLGDWHGRNE